MLENTKGKIKNVKEYLRDNQKCWRIPKGSQMDNAEKLETQDTQKEGKQNKNTTQYVLDTNIRKQTQIP